MDEVLIGLDAGTSAVKTVAFAPGGAELARATRENETIGDGDRIEQDMEGTWDRAAATVREVVDELDDETVVAVGVTGQGDGCWLVDGAGDPVRNAILWSDGRAAGVLDEWDRSGVMDRLFEVCGSTLFPGAALPLLRWLADNEPGTLDRAETLLFCKDWIKYRLTGELTTDLSDASIPFLDVRAGEYSDEIPGVVDLPGLESLYPRIEPATTVVGGITAGASEATGLPEGTPVVSGVVDVVASAFGSGVATPGESSSVVGTTSVNGTLLEAVPEDQTRTGYTIAIDDDLYARVLASMAGTPNLEWAREQLATDGAFETLESAAESVPVGADGVLYHPYLSKSGERSPFLDPDARAGFVGLEPSHTRAHLLRAVYEGVALAARDCYEHVPAAVDSVAVSGGGARSAFWTQLFADCLDATVTVPAGTEFGARGAAILAGLSQECYPDLPTAVDRTVTTQRTHHPRPGPARRYDRWYRVYTTARDGLADAWALRSSVLDEFDR